MAPLDASNAALQVPLAGVSNAVAACFTNPMDVIKVRMQMDGAGVSTVGFTKKYRNPPHAAVLIIREEGVQGLYRGLTASIVREFSYSGIRMGMYEPIKQLYGATDPTNTPFYLKVLAGGTTGAFGAIIANPCDLIKVRMQSSGVPGGRPAYASVGEVLRELMRDGGGVKGLWRGSVPTVQRAALLTASQMPSYDHTKHFLVDNGHVSEGYLCHFFCSMVAGVVCATTTSPVDLIKSRVMAQPLDPKTGKGTLYAGTFDCAKSVIRKEGPQALFKGYNCQWLRMGPHTTISLMAFEYFRGLMGMEYL